MKLDNCSSILAPLLAVALGLLLGNVIDVVEAYPSGAGACLAGEASVAGSSHATPDAKRGYLGQANLDVDLVANSDTHDFTISLTSSSIAGGFRGFLIRIECKTCAVTPDDPAVSQIAGACSGQDEVGVTHVDSSVKRSVSATIDFAESEEFKIDVTAVVSNNDEDGSEYYYSYFAASATVGIPMPAPMPAPAPGNMAP